MFRFLHLSIVSRSFSAGPKLFRLILLKSPSKWAIEDSLYETTRGFPEGAEPIDAWLLLLEVLSDRSDLNDWIGSRSLGKNLLQA